MHNTTLIILMLACISLRAQNTVGVLQYEEESLEGYTLFSPFSGTKAFMVDNCGQLINEWDRGTRPGLSAYFLENGLLFRTYKTGPVGPYTSASNAGGIELVDWNNERVWYYELDTPTALSHHDAKYMPNGNILLLSWELVYTEELVALGRDPNEIAPEGYMWSERILELEPVGTNAANIVWEWRIKDHYIQDFDPTKLNYGVVADHPELFNINLPELNSSNSNSTRDWNHFNSIDYQEELDQILISTRNSDEIWILDHSTTTEEAASHEGGRYGKGGDLLYRWGNASAYNRGPISEQRLFGQHGVYWVREESEWQGKIMLFNNGNGRPGADFSTVEVIDPPQDANGGYILSENEPFGPIEAEVIYGANSDEEYFYSPYLSNAQVLPNGNILVNPGSTGVVFEIDGQGNKVWEYVIPLFGDFPAAQGQNVFNNSTFRAYKFAPDFSGFEGISIEPGETIESGTDLTFCMLTSTEEPVKDSNSDFSVYYNSVEHTLEINRAIGQDIQVVLYNLNGYRWKLQGQLGSFSLPQLPGGIYFVQLIRKDKVLQTERISLF